MIDQRVSQGINSNFFNRKALTTTIPAHRKKWAKIVPIYIETKRSKFQIEISKSIEFSNNDSIETITENLNYVTKI